ncbi:hypothetical protein NQ317_018780, partial [Molorchus minor]
PNASHKSLFEVKKEPTGSCENYNKVENVTNTFMKGDETIPKNIQDDQKQIEKLLVKHEIESDIDENFELSQSDIEKEFEAFNKEDEETNSGLTMLENDTTVYKCKMCEKVFVKFPEYKYHKKQHFIEKRRVGIIFVTRPLTSVVARDKGQPGSKP